MMTHPLRAVVATWLAGALLVPFVSAAASAVDPLSVPGFVTGMVAGVVVAFVVAGVPYIGLSVPRLAVTERRGRASDVHLPDAPTS